MCGRFANHVKQAGEWAEMLKDWPEEAEISYNIAPTQMIPAFTAEQGMAMRWGMIPPWSKQADSKYATFNARSESVSEKPAFRNAWNKSQTCLIPASGYYEWQGEKGNKTPIYIHTTNGEPLVMAGLWEQWGAGESLLHSCTILTLPSAGKLTTVHSRMPLMLEIDQAEQWLNDGTVAFEQIMEEQNIERLSFYEVDKAVNKSTNEGAHLIEKTNTN